jgi:hypothetical protein
MNAAITVIGETVALAMLGRYVYCHLAPHGSIIIGRGCGGYVLCNCGKVSQDYRAWDLLGVWRWRKGHRTARRHREGRQEVSP